MEGLRECKPEDIVKGATVCILDNVRYSLDDIEYTTPIGTRWIHMRRVGNYTLPFTYKIKRVATEGYFYTVNRNTMDYTRCILVEDKAILVRISIYERVARDVYAEMRRQDTSTINGVTWSDRVDESITTEFMAQYRRMKMSKLGI